MTRVSMKGWVVISSQPEGMDCDQGEYEGMGCDQFTA